jgi:hypothetical protein
VGKKIEAGAEVVTDKAAKAVKATGKAAKNTGRKLKQKSGV